MKRIFASVSVALIALCVNAQSSWNFSDWDVQTLSSSVTKDGLTVAATSTCPVTIDANSKTIDNYSFTKRLKLGGTGSDSARYVNFDVTGNSDIAVYSISSSSSATRTLKVAAGSLANVVSSAEVVGTAIGKTTYSYKGDATTIYIYSASGGINLYGIYVTASSDGGSTGGGSSSSSNISAYDASAPVGWASVNGSTTGSSDKNPVTVTTLSQLTAALTAARKITTGTTIYIKGEIATSGYVTLQDASNITIYGLPGSALTNSNRETVSSTGILDIKRCKNIILRNLTFKSAGAYDIDGNDNLTVQSSTYIWVDHCDFQDGVDGNFDCNNGSDNISVTWCRFRYLIAPKSGGSGGSSDHRFSDLWGGDDDVSADVGHLNTTFANCWWDEGCKERMPRARHGKIHIVNCLYSSSVASYCIGAGYLSNIYVENSVFSSTKAKETPWKSAATASGYTDYNITLKGNIGVSDGQYKSGSNDYFTPDYNLTAYDPQYVQSALTDADTGAGATLDIAEGQAFTTGISSAETTNDVAQTTYYTLSGEQISTPLKGVNIIKKTMSDGTVETSKIIMK